MSYLIVFLEGIITFLSPCLLPMLPIYLSYFAGGIAGGTRRTVLGALGFVTGFTAVFVAMGALAGTLGSLLHQYQTAVNLVSGLVVMVFGLYFLGVGKLSWFRGGGKAPRQMGFFPALAFGVIFALGWTPCVGAFLGTALLLASQQGSTLQGMVMLLLYALGLGIPFVLSALLMDYLKSAFTWVKAHYRLINTVSGVVLLVVGAAMATGLMGRLLTLLG